MWCLDGVGKEEGVGSPLLGVGGLSGVAWRKGEFEEGKRRQGGADRVASRRLGRRQEGGMKRGGGRAAEEERRRMKAERRRRQGSKDWGAVRSEG